MSRSRNIICVPIFAVLLLLIGSCTSVRSDLTTAPLDSEIYDIAKSIRSSCFQTPHPNFSGKLNSSEFLPSVQMEGLWKQDYQILLMRLEGVMGEEYGNITLNQNHMQMTLAENPQMQKKSFLDLESFLSSLGAHGTRNLICGNYAFDIQREEDFAISKSNHQNYVSVSHIDLNGHEVTAQNKIHLEKSNGKVQIAVESHFSYGFLINDSDVKIVWSGFIQNQSVHLDSILFHFKENKQYSFIFDEYQ